MEIRHQRTNFIMLYQLHQNQQLFVKFQKKKQVSIQKLPKGSPCGWGGSVGQSKRPCPACKDFFRGIEWIGI